MCQTALHSTFRARECPPASVSSPVARHPPVVVQDARQEQCRQGVARDETGVPHQITVSLDSTGELIHFSKKQLSDPEFLSNLAHFLSFKHEQTDARQRAVETSFSEQFGSLGVGSRQDDS